MNRWLAFVVLTLVGALVIHALPPVATGDGGDVGLVAAALVAAFANALLAFALAPWLVNRLADRRGSLLAAAGRPGGGLTESERASQTDRAAIALMVVGVVAMAVAGLANRPLIVSETDETEAAGRAVLDYADRSGDPELERNVETANIYRRGEDRFRVCVANDARDGFICLLVATDTDPPTVTRDPSDKPNPSVK